MAVESGESDLVAQVGGLTAFWWDAVYVAGGVEVG